MTTELCYILYTVGHGPTLYVIRIHPMASKKQIEQKLHLYSPDARLLDFRFANFTADEIEQIILKGRFPDVPAT